MGRRAAGSLAAFCFACLLLPASPAQEAAPDLDSLRFNEVQFKAAHNSIDREEPLTEQLDWDATRPHQGGCRGLELDLVQDPKRTDPTEDWVFGVQHGGPLRPETPPLLGCLRAVRRWSEVHPRHEVITIHLDLKEEATLGKDAVFAEKIDGILERELGRERIFTPPQLQGDAPTLLAGARKHGWPTLGALRGKFILVFSGGDDEGPVARRRRAYTMTEPGKRLVFVDLDQRAAGAGGADECDIRSPYYEAGSRVFVNIQLGRKDWARLAREARGRGFVTREWKANDEESWRRAREAGVNILSTDRVRNYPWASVGTTLFARQSRG